jgi:hypothetical protein
MFAIIETFVAMVDSGMQAMGRIKEILIKL